MNSVVIVVETRVDEITDLTFGGGRVLSHGAQFSVLRLADLTDLRLAELHESIDRAVLIAKRVASEATK